MDYFFVYTIFLLFLQLYGLERDDIGIILTANNFFFKVCSTFQGFTYRVADKKDFNTKV